ncbi:hypothetical protein H70357_34120 [Paenibacillus sp. FSL H7-0357]|uniref:hypothetical protein n=1 Tax=unclassified Paenibacillus TaxID=185978 RepID=UPI0004F6841D|nr:hypothetical protein [Paenibacillus sp. FSL H7-0357]AIQ21162.1 hypothetical protein H70357_34120 [Paenibacillus sp. FSL H7-0357]
MSIYKTILWRELKKDKLRIKANLLSIFFIILGNYVLIRYKSAFQNYDVYLLLAIYFVFQMEMIISDINQSIESLLALPINVEDVWLGKTIYLICKCIVVSVVNIMILFAADVSFNMNFLEVACLLTWVTAYHLMLYKLIWHFGKKYKFAVLLLDYLVYYMILSLNKQDFIIAVLVSFLLIIVMNGVLRRKIRKERIVRRSL